MKQIRVGGLSVGVCGLGQALEDLAPTMADADDEEIGKALMARLAKENYIPDGVRHEYEEAFVREFHRHLGRSVTEGRSSNLEIKVLGPGCPQCEKLVASVRAVLVEMGIAADLGIWVPMSLRRHSNHSYGTKRAATRRFVVPRRSWEPNGTQAGS